MPGETKPLTRIPAPRPALADGWYARSPDAVAVALGVDPDVGLSAGRAADLLRDNGPNALPEEKPKPGWRRFLEQYRSYMQVILVAAALVSLLISEWSTGILLAALTILNAVIGMRQEGKAESAMNALKSMMKATARVRRDGSESVIPAEQVVPGDVVLITAGDEVPADGRIIAASALQIDESALTGESTPAAKGARALPGGDLGPGDQVNMAFMNTPVTHGSGTMIVTGTGARTELGKISGMLSATAVEESPLTIEMNRLTLWIAAAAGLTMVVMFALGRARGRAWDDLFTAAVSLAIAAIPEALPTVAQMILSVGGVGLASRNAIVKDLPSVETLGFTSAINSDKTGTLTMNQMTAVELVDPVDRYTISGAGYDLEGKVHHAAGSTDTIEDAVLPYLIASDAKLVDGKVVGDPTEGALLILGYKAGLDIEATRERLPRLATLPFDPSYKLMATFNSTVDAAGRSVVRCFVKGAAPAVMDRAATALAGGTSLPWDAELRGKAQANVERMGSAGQRVMAAATRDLDPDGFDPDGDLLGYVTGLQMVSLVGMVDPPREEAAAAVAEAQAAHIRVRMVTGDDVVTGAAIAKQLGIDGEAILGADFAALPESERLARIDRIGVVGRVAPEHKVLLADTLKKKGDVVAMTGDGVNDAPAIKAADIGIAMGTGTEVAKNAGRMILSDDNFATIVFAVEQGRKIYDNLTKYIRFVLVLLVTFVLTFLGATLFNIAAGEPFTPAQVLWIHFFVNAPFGFALGFDKETPGLMTLRPRHRGQSVLTSGMLITVGLTGLAITIGLLSMIAVGQHVFGSVPAGQSIAFTSFALCLIVAAVECRSESATALTTATFDSRQMNWAMLGEAVLAVLVTQMDLFNRLLGTTQLNLRQFGWALIPAIALLAAWELGKCLARRSLPQAQQMTAPGRQVHVQPGARQLVTVPLEHAVVEQVVNPPVQAWAALEVFAIDGGRDIDFLSRIFDKLLVNFAWWVNREDVEGNNIFEGGFLGLDNIGPLDRSHLPVGGTLEQSDATGWMGAYAIAMAAIATVLNQSRQRPANDLVLKFLEHFAAIRDALESQGLWDEADGIYYDRLVTPSAGVMPVKVRSMVGLIPALAAVVIEEGDLRNSLSAGKQFADLLVREGIGQPDKLRDGGVLRGQPGEQRLLLSLAGPHRLERLLAKLFDEREFLSPHGLRALSARHRDHPYVMVTMLERYHRFFGDDYAIEYPTGSGQRLHLGQVAADLSGRLISIFTEGPDGRRPCFGGTELMQADPAWHDNLIFSEYFHGDNGAAIGAFHQTGWTGLVADLIRRRHGAVEATGDVIRRVAAEARAAGPRPVPAARTAGADHPVGVRAGK